MTVPPFAVISGAQVQDALAGREKQIVELVEATYRLHGAGDSVNPPSYFLRFPDRPSSRIISLPASIGGQVHTRLRSPATLSMRFTGGQYLAARSHGLGKAASSRL